MSVRISIPSSFQDVTIAQFQAFQLATNDWQKVQAISGATMKDVMKIKMSEITKLVSVCELVMSEQSRSFKALVTFNGVDYGFEPNLQGMSTALYVDLATWCAPVNFNNSLSKIIAALYRPVTKRMGKRYDIEEYDSDKHLPNAEILSQMSASILGGVLDFFTVLNRNLKATTLSSLEDSIERTRKELEQMKARNLKR
jgi:hypothetical protein